MTHPNLESALYAIPAHDRDIWVRMAMAVKAALGDDGFAVWDKWSQQANSYASRDARSVWRSVRPNGGITVGSLYAEAKANGWEGEPVNPRPTPAERRRRVAQAARERQETERRHKEAGKRAEQMIEAATLERHPYLAAKGFPTHQGLALNGALLVPMRDFRSGRLLTLQLIQLDGSKKFLAGGRAKGAAYRLGSHQTRWYCEGYATGLSIAAALRTYLYRRDQVVVCFSAGNLAYVASERGYVVADHDASEAGEIYARKTGLPYWLPPELGDANDFHQRHGLQALADALRGFMGEARIR